MGTREIFLSAVIPAIASLAVLLALHVLLRARKSRLAAAEADSVASQTASGPVTLSVAFVALLAFGVVLGSFAWQSRVDLWADSVTHRFPAIAAVALLIGLLSVLTPLRRSMVGGAVLATVGGSAVGWMVVGALHESLISETERWGWIAGLGAIAGLQSWSMGMGARALSGWRGPGILWLLLGVCGLGATGGLANAPLVLWPVSASAFGLATIGLLRREVDLLAGTTPAVSVVFVGVLAVSNWFGATEQWLMFTLLGAAPLAIGLAAIFPKKSAWLRLAVAAIVGLGLSGVQASMSVPALIEASTGGGDDPYDY